jgi:CRP/FNR family cyclic AMP-dependent transcriptional regulator
MVARLRKEEKIQLLGRLPLFENCTRRELGQIAAIMTEAERPEGAYLTREGRDGGLMFILVDGSARVVANGRTLGRLGPGDVLGELSLIDGQARSASVVATAPVRVLQLAADDFRRLTSTSPKFVKALLRSLSARVRQMEKLTA